MRRLTLRLRLLWIGLPLLALALGVTAQTPPERVPITAENAGQIVPLGGYPARYSWRAWSSRDGARVLISSSPQSGEDTAWAIDLDEGWQVDFSFTALALSPDGMLAVTTRWGVGTQLVNLLTGESWPVSPAESGRARFGTDGSHFITWDQYWSGGDVPHDLNVWETATRQLIYHADTYEAILDGPPIAREALLNEYMAVFSASSVSGGSVNPTTATPRYGLLLDPAGEALIQYTAEAITVMDAATLTVERIIPNCVAMAGEQAAALSPDGHALLLVNREVLPGALSRACLFDLDVSSDLPLWSIDFADYQDFIFSPDGTLIAAYTRKTPRTYVISHITLLNRETGTPYAEITDADLELTQCDFVPGGSLFVTTGRDLTIRLWDWSGPALPLVAILPGGSNVMMTPDGATLLTRLDGYANTYGEWLVYGVQTGTRPVRPISLPGRIAASAVNLYREPRADAEIIGTVKDAVRVAARSGDFAYLPAQDGWVRTGPLYLLLMTNEAGLDLLPEIEVDQIAALATPTPVPVGALASAPTAVPPSTPIPLPLTTPTTADDTLPDPPSGLMRITPETAAEVRLLDFLRYREPGESYGTNLVVAREVACLSALRTGSNRWHFLRAWNLVTLDELDPGVACSSPDQPLGPGLPQGDHIYHAFNADRSRVAVFGVYTNLIQLFAFDGTAYTLIRNYAPGRHNDREGVSLSADGRWLAYQSERQVYLLNVETGALREALPLVNYGLDWMAFSPDQRWLAVVANWTVSVIEVESGELLYQGAAGWIRPRAVFSPDSRLLLVVEPVRLIDLETWEEFPFEGNYRLWDAQFTPDGASLIGLDGYGVLVFGVPVPERPAMPPVVARVVPSGIQVRANPDPAAPVIGTASGEVRITGRSRDNHYVYAPDLGGWLRMDGVYLDLGDYRADWLPYMEPSPGE